MSEKDDTPRRVLVVDDEYGLRQLLDVVLSAENYAVDTFGSGKEAMEAFRRDPHQVVITDLRMEGIDGIAVLKEVQKIQPGTPVIVITAFGTWANAVDAMRHGAYDYIKKPFDNENIKFAVAKAMHHARAYVDYTAGEQPLMRHLVGNSPAIQEIRKLISRIAATDSTVLIQGESGTGKELVARALHSASLRADCPLFAVNCGAFTENLLESELFGHVKGAFTGAVVDKRGMFEVAGGGTFFLDEVTELLPVTQVKLLRVLEEREIRPVGSTKALRVDLRIIAASNRDIEQEVRDGNFREDLYYRLNVISFTLPPLRERKEDIPLIAGHLLARFSAEMKKPLKSIDAEAMQALIDYDWPGNVRELGNILQRAMLLAEEDCIHRAGLVGRLRIASPADRILSADLPDKGFNLENHLIEIERKFIAAALEKTSGNITQAADLLSTSFRSLRYRIKKLGIKAG